MATLNFSIKNVRVETVIDSIDMVFFTLKTDLGEVDLSEYINYDSDGDFKSVEFADSNIRCNLVVELCSVFDMSEKPGFMPMIDYVPFYEVIDAVSDVVSAILSTQPQ